MENGRANSKAPSGPATAAPTKGNWRSFLRVLGPGLVTGASDDDPSGIATYSQAGAQYGLGLLWVSLVSLPLMAGVQEICDRTALATGQGLGELAAKKYPGKARRYLAVLIAALIIANALNIAADLVAIGSGMNLLHAGPVWIWALIAGGLITVLVIAGNFAQISRIFNVLCLSVLTYFFVMFSVHVNWSQVAIHTVVPHISFSKGFIALLVAVLGTTISPYLFFWQSAHRLEEMREEPEGGSRALPLHRRSIKNAIWKTKTSRVDVFFGMTLSNLVMFAIIVSAASTLHGKTIDSAAAAAAALKPVAGKWAADLFAIGFIGTGMLAVPVLAGAGAAGMAGLLGHGYGFSRSIRKAPVFYILVAVGTLGGALLSLLTHNPIQLLVIVAVINGVAAAPFLLLVMLISSDKKIMGEYRNGPLASTIGWITFAIMAIASLTLLAQALGL
jgi:NRAMP (natural resistance-associated macrophage protein)-like metal ion transporter